MRYKFIKVEKANYPITILCKVMQVARSGYYAWTRRPKPMRQRQNEKLVPIVKKIHAKSDETYGTRRIAMSLIAKGIYCGRARARTLMRLAGVQVKHKRRFKITTDSKHKLEVSPNLLDRNFTSDEPNVVWVSDITYVWTDEGWLYLAVVIDLFNRQVVGWSMRKRLATKLVIDAFKMAIWRRRPAPGLIFHSDRGSQYCSALFRKTLKAYGVLSSMSKKGDCWDNAPAESFFASLKKDRIYWRHYHTREEAKQDIFDYLEMFYNSERLHSSLGYVSPREFENAWLIANAS